MNNTHVLLYFLVFIIMSGCKESEAIPKPKAQIRLDYPQGKLATLETSKFSINYNQLANPKENKDMALSLIHISEPTRQDTRSRMACCG